MLEISLYLNVQTTLGLINMEYISNKTRKEWKYKYFFSSLPSLIWFEIVNERRQKEGITFSILALLLRDLCFFWKLFDMRKPFFQLYTTLDKFLRIFPPSYKSLNQNIFKVKPCYLQKDFFLYGSFGKGVQKGRR